tara:strand:- start:359 stop:580 length:222 start_codon:yes stop_codon:yes gene_type:complete
MPQNFIPVVGKEVPEVLQPDQRIRNPKLPIESDRIHNSVIAEIEKRKGDEVESNIRATQQIQALKGFNVDKTV